MFYTSYHWHIIKQNLNLNNKHKMKKEMDKATKIMSDVVIHMKYAKYNPELNRRETWEELVTRNKLMHIKKYPNLKDEIEEVYKFVYDKKVLPSMRSLQFGGKPISISPNRVYNCAYLPIDSIDSFHETMFLLLACAKHPTSRATHLKSCAKHSIFEAKHPNSCAKALDSLEQFFQQL